MPDELNTEIAESPASSSTPAPESSAPVSPAAAPDQSSTALEVSTQPSALPSGQPASVTPTPFGFRADRSDYEIDGATVNAEGNITIPKAQAEYVKQLLAEGVAHRGSWQRERDQYESRIADLERSVESHPDITRARAYSNQIKALMAQPPEKIAEWLDNLAVNQPAFEAKAEAELYRTQYEATQTQAREAQETADAQALVPEMEQIAQGIVGELASQYPGVDQGQMYERLMNRHVDRIFKEVPANSRRMGLRDGEVLFGRSRDGQTLYVADRGFIEDEFKHAHSLSGKSATAATNAVKQNAAALASAVPPTATGQQPMASGSPTKPLPRTQAEFDKWFQGDNWKGSFPGKTA